LLETLRTPSPKAPKVVSAEVLVIYRERDGLSSARSITPPRPVPLTVCLSAHLLAAQVRVFRSIGILRYDVADYVAGYVGQPEIAAAVAIGQLGMF
jgi:hypothetical protein